MASARYYGISCQAKLYVYSDLEGRPTGEFDFDCAGSCPGGAECTKVVNRAGDYFEIYCSCGGNNHPSYEEGTCSLRLHVVRDANGHVRLRPQCSYRPCQGEDGECFVCQVASFGKGQTILDLDKPTSRVRSYEEFRCECKPYAPSKKLVEFYENWICKIVTFALAHGSTLSRKDLYHAHVILDAEAPDQPVDYQGTHVLGDDFLVDHFRGLLGHAHESDHGRSVTEDNFNIYVDADGNVHFAGSTKTVDQQNRGGIPGVFDWTQIHFRFCEPNQACPPCVTKIHCRGIDRDICVAWRRLWPEGDPALG
jgi:hypothetical protein